MTAVLPPLSRASSAPPPTRTASCPADAKLSVPAGNTLVRGDLVTYERDPRYAAAWTLYVVLGEARRDSQAHIRIPIQALHRQILYGTITTFHPMDVRTDELVPLGDYGMRIRKMVRRLDGHSSNFLFLERDPSIEATAPRRFGRPLGDKWDWCGFGQIDSDELAGLIRDPDLLLTADDCATGIDADSLDDDLEDVGEEAF